MRSKIKKNINPRILFRIGIVLLMCFFRRAQRLSNRGADRRRAPIRQTKFG